MPPIHNWVIAITAMHYCNTQNIKWYKAKGTSFACMETSYNQWLRGKKIENEYSILIYYQVDIECTVKG